MVENKRLNWPKCKDFQRQRKKIISGRFGRIIEAVILAELAAILLA